MHNLAIGTITIFLYLTAAVMLTIRLRNRITTTASRWKGLFPAVIAVVLHTWMLSEVLFIDKGLDLGIYNAISLITWLIAIMLLISAINRPTENLGIIIFPGTALAVALENLFASGHSHITQTLQSQIEIHIYISIIAYSILSIAAVQAILLAIQDRQLRHKHPGGIIRALPPLQTMESLLFKLIALGFIMQSLSLLSGLMFLENMFAQHLVHKTVLSIIAWFMFAVLLWGRWRFGWRGRKAIRLTLSGFGALALSYLGSKVVLEVILGRG